MSSLIPKLPADPPRPDIGRPSSMLTVVALGLAVVAWALMLPAFVQSLDWSGMPGDPNEPAIWTLTPYRRAFFVGLASLILGILALARQRRGDSKQGRWLARCAVGLSVLGAMAWTYVALLSVNASL